MKGTERKGTTAEEMQKRALVKALSLGLHKRVVRVAYGRYTVPSTTTGEHYTVTHNPGQDEALFCTCPGRSHPACAHRAAVWLRKQEAKGVRVMSPARKERAAWRSTGRTWGRDQERNWDRATVEAAGRAAYGAGEPLTANPYPDTGGMACSGRYSAWLMGWRRAEWETQRADYEAQRSRWGRGEA